MVFVTVPARVTGAWDALRVSAHGSRCLANKVALCLESVTRGSSKGLFLLSVRGTTSRCEQPCAEESRVCGEGTSFRWVFCFARFALFRCGAGCWKSSIAPHLRVTVRGLPPSPLWPAALQRQDGSISDSTSAATFSFGKQGKLYVTSQTNPGLVTALITESTETHWRNRVYDFTSRQLGGHLSVWCDRHEVCRALEDDLCLRTVDNFRKPLHRLLDIQNQLLGLLCLGCTFFLWDCLLAHLLLRLAFTRQPQTLSPKKGQLPRLHLLFH